jgi:hypothetical protein
MYVTSVYQLVKFQLLYQLVINNISIVSCYIYYFVTASMHERHEIFNKLQGETLVRKGLFDRYNERPLMRILPELNVIKIGGHGIIDYGREVVLPLVEEIGALSKEHQVMIITGGGVRVRHIMDIGLDLGMPTGVLAELTSKISEQNAMMLATLSIHIMQTNTQRRFLELPTLLGMGALRFRMELRHMVCTSILRNAQMGAFLLIGPIPGLFLLQKFSGQEAVY